MARVNDSADYERVIGDIQHRLSDIQARLSKELRTCHFERSKRHIYGAFANRETLRFAITIVIQTSVTILFLNDWIRTSEYGPRNHSSPTRKNWTP